MAEINGKIIAQKILDRIREKVTALGRKPVLAVVVVGEDPVSAKYIARKAQAAEYVGIDFYIHRYPSHIVTKQLIEDVKRIQLRCDAMIVQLPLPKQIDTHAVLDAVDTEKDADCLSAESAGRVVRGSTQIFPPTASAILEILNSKKVALKGKHVVVVGQGELVGKPVASMMMSQPVTLTVCGLGTTKLSDHTKLADILITGVGKPNLITGSMVKKGVIVIDAGTSIAPVSKKSGYAQKSLGLKDKLSLSGDVNFESVSKKAKLITPVPGGVGPVTVAKLLENVFLLTKK